MPGDEPLMLGVRLPVRRTQRDAGDLAAFEQTAVRYKAEAWRVACGFAAR
jgi:hypothetical protein